MARNAIGNDVGAGFSILRASQLGRKNLEPALTMDTKGAVCSFLAFFPILSNQPCNLDMDSVWLYTKGGALEILSEDDMSTRASQEGVPPPDLGVRIQSLHSLLPTYRTHAGEEAPSVHDLAYQWMEVASESYRYWLLDQLLFQIEVFGPLTPIGEPLAESMTTASQRLQDLDCMVQWATHLMQEVDDPDGRMPA